MMRLAKFALLLGTLVCSAIAAEFLLRFLTRDITSTSTNIGYFSLRWKASQVRLNSAGYRDREWMNEKRPARRIAVIGDSIAFGQGVPVERRFSNVLEAELRQEGMDVQVLNFSRPGAQTIDEVGILQDVLRTSAPQLVILQWYVNDLEGELPPESKVRFRPLLPLRLHNPLIERSVLYYFANQAWIQWQEKKTWKGSFRGFIHTHLRDERGAGFLAYRSTLNRFIQECRRARIPLIVALFPRFHHQKDFDYFYDRMAVILKENGVACVDLRPAFEEIPGELRGVNRLDDHPGPLPHQVAAREIKKEILKILTVS